MGDSQSNGAAEQAVREVKAKVRSLKLAAEKLHKMTIGAEHPVVTWMVE